MKRQRMQLLKLSITLLCWFHTTADCWKFDGGGGGDVDFGDEIANHKEFSINSLGPRVKRSTAVHGPPVIPNNSGSYGALLNAQQQDALFACPLNSMCQCVGLPNETSTLIEINCNEVALYKFPGKHAFPNFTSLKNCSPNIPTELKCK